jgi:hypothetical protein
MSWLLNAFLDVPIRVVALHSGRIAHLCRIGVLAKLAPGPALLEQVPALVQGNLEPAQVSGFVVVQPMILFRSLMERMLLVDELPDPLQDLCIFHLAMLLS